MEIISINRHRFGIDGNGITTLVGLQHCPLNCKYCINKDAITKAKTIYMTPQELLDEILIDYCYFVATQGGVTFGGAEPLLQAQEILEFSNIIPNGVRINIETSLNVHTFLLEIIINKIDLFIIDIKDINSTIYQEYTSKNNNLVLKNLEYISSTNHQDKCRIRIPIIPNYNSEENRIKSIQYLKTLGFKDFDKFNYVIDKPKKR